MQLEAGPSIAAEEPDSEEEDEADGTAEARLVPADSSVCELRESCYLALQVEVYRSVLRISSCFCSAGPFPGAL